MNLLFKPTFKEVWERGRFDVSQFSRDFLSIDPHEGQQKWFDTRVFALERFLSSGNRWGKSIGSSIKHLHHLLYQTRDPRYAEQTSNYVRANVSITLDIASIAWKKAYQFAVDSPLYRQFVMEDETRKTPFPMMVVGYGKDFRSQLWARSTARNAEYLLSHTFDGINYDEAAQDPNGLHILDNVLRNRVIDRNAGIDFTSTGNFKNWYYQMCMKAARDESGYFYYQTGSTYDNPHIPKNRIDINAQNMSEIYKAQNIFGGFADTANYFPMEKVEACYKDIDYSYPIPPHREGRYIAGLDFGRKNDTTVLMIADISKDPAPLVYVDAMGGAELAAIDWVGEHGIYERVCQGLNRYNAEVWMDTTGMAGDVIYQTLIGTYGLSPERAHAVDVSGGGGKKKQNLVQSGRESVQGKWITWSLTSETIPLKDQLVLYDLPDDHLVTDYVMAYCHLAEGVRQGTFREIEDDTPLLYSVGLRTLTHEFSADSGVPVSVGEEDYGSPDWY